MDSAPRASAALPPLAGRTVLVTRPEGGGDLQRRLEALGARVLAIPATTIEPLDPAPLDAALQALARYRWAVVTSRNAVQLVLERLRRMGRHPDALTALRIAAVGSATAEALRQRGLEPAMVPGRFSADGVLEAFRQRDDVRGTRVLYATAEGAADTLPDGLQALGAQVDRIPCYRSVRDVSAVPALAAAATTCDVVTLTAPSTVAAWASAVGAAAAGVPVVSIGSVTSEAARSAGLRVVAEADPSTAEGLADAVRRYFAST